MPLAYDIDPVQRLVTITGEYSDAAEWQDVLGRVLDDARHEVGFRLLRDLRKATTPVDPATVVGVIDVVRHFWPLLQPSRVAILTSRDPDPAALVAHALADAQNLQLRTFTNYHDAIAWLQERSG